MPSFRFSISTRYRKELEQLLRRAQQLGDLRRTKYLLAILAVMDSHSFEAVASMLKLTPKTVGEWVRLFLCYGITGAPRRKTRGRTPKLTPEQKQELARLIEAGPQACGFAGACWRSPMIQHLIKERFGIFYNVFYIAQLLKSLGFSFQKAAFVSAHLDEVARQRWRRQLWPQILRQARDKKALLLFGDEASFPQWGTLSYTWARRGHQPTVKTSGKRKGWKVFGLVDYFTGQFFHQGLEGRLTSATYTAFLARVLEQSTQHIILIQDGARYHTSAHTTRFFAQHAERLTVYQLPSYSPDYNPIEKLWKKIKEAETHLHYFPTFGALNVEIRACFLCFHQAARRSYQWCSPPTGASSMIAPLCW